MASGESDLQRRVSRKPIVPDPLLAHWQAVVDVLAEAGGFPVVLITRVYPEFAEVLAASHNPQNPFRPGSQVPRDPGIYCELVISQRREVMINDARNDPRWQGSIELDMNLVAYMGIPLHWPNGEIFGTLCALDRTPREYANLFCRLMEQMCRCVEADLALLTQVDASERALQESGQIFATIFSESALGMAIMGLDRTFLETNPALQRMLGYTHEELKTLSVPSITYPDDRALDAQMAQELRAGLREFYQIDKRYIRKDGSVRWGKVTVSVVRDSEGIPSFNVALVEDVTERHEAEEARRASEERLRVFHELSLDGAAILHAVRDGSGQVVEFEFDYANAVTRRDSGLSEVAGGHLLELLPCHRTNSLFERYVAVVETGQSLDVEVPLDKNDGRRWLRMMVVKQDDGVAVSYSDITGRKHAEEERNRMAMAVEQTAEAIVITDSKGYFQYVNPAFTRMSGYELKEIRGKTPRILRSGCHDDAFYEGMWKMLKAGEVWRGEVVNLHKDGHLYTQQTTITPVRNADGAVTNFVAIQEDVSERRHLEAQLRQAQKLEAVGRLAGGIAHDFNNLLTAIMGSAELISAQLPPTDHIMPEVEEIRQAAERAATLTRQLLVFSRRQVLQTRNVDLNALVENLDRMLRRLIGEDVELISRLSPDLPAIVADPGQVEQVLLNLVVNARDAMPGGGKLVVETSRSWIHDPVVRAADILAPGEYVLLTVSDTGVGIPEELASRVFEPFFTTKEEGKGTGLGLSTVYGIVRQTGGAVTFDSRAGHGTVFNVYFPAAQEKHESTDVPVPKQSSSKGTGTVLVVEDEEIVRKLVCRVLTKHGYTALETPGGAEALELLRQRNGQVDLVISDVVMPGMSGPDLAQKVRELYPQARILLMSGHVDRHLPQHVMESGGFAFLSKPFTPDGLAQKIRELLGNLR